MSSKPEVTIIVAPRERFSYTRESLESIYEHTQVPFKLIYVDGGSPSHIKKYLENQAQEKQFQIIRTEHYLSPNHARNLGLRQVDTKYVVFIDNDATRRRIIEKIFKQGRKVADVRPQLQRQETGLAEFHCMIVRTEIFDKIGLLDEGLLNTKEHVDLCILVAEAGGSVYLEPDSLVTYVPGPPLELSDVGYYMLRWSDGWEMASLKRLREKWNLSEDKYFQNKYKRLGWRRKMTIIDPISKNLSFGNRFLSKVIGKVVGKADRLLNHYITTSYARKHLQNNSSNQNPPTQPPSAVTASSQG